MIGALRVRFFECCWTSLYESYVFMLTHSHLNTWKWFKISNNSTTTRETDFLACEQQRHRPVCTSAQSDLRLYYSWRGAVVAQFKGSYTRCTQCDWWLIFCCFAPIVHVWIQRGGGGGRAFGPWNITKNIGFLSNIGPDPLKIIKLPSQHSMLGHHRPACETPFKWRFAGGPLMVR